MASLREIKDRIGSVRSTLKITSAMKLVASSKLRKAQKAIEGLRPYEQALDGILSVIATAPSEDETPRAGGKTAVVVISSNNSLCGAFNSNVIRTCCELVAGLGDDFVVFPVGKKVAEAMRRRLPSDRLSPVKVELLNHSSYDKSSAFAGELRARFDSGEFSKVVLVYNRFVSVSSQKPVVEQYLPFVWKNDGVAQDDEKARERRERFIFEPDAEQIAADLLPQLLGLKFHAAILDSTAAEHAARTIAMQTATDNGERLLSELTLEYNKGRQQKITSEILDLVGGSEAGG